MSKYCIMGNGLIATALKEKIGEHCWYPEQDTEFIFYLEGPTHMDFEKEPNYFASKELADLMRLHKYYPKAKIVYPSSALVYEGSTEFSRHKRSIEYILRELKNTVIVRIFPVYGKEEKTFIGQAIKKIKNNESPVVFGDGTQSRDFVFIEDVVDQLLYFSTKEDSIYDIGTGELTSFNSIIYLINKTLDKSIEPIYIQAPENYKLEGVRCSEPYHSFTSIEEGIKKLCEL